MDNSSTNNRHVCQPGQFQIQEILQQIPPLAKLGGGCPKHEFAGGNPLLLKPPLDSFATMASTFKSQPPDDLLANMSYVGWSHLVAPSSKNAGASGPTGSNPSLPRDVSELFGRAHALSKMAPSLSATVRKILERDQIQVQTIQAHMDRLKKNTRYDSAFKLLWGLCKAQGLDPALLSGDDIATQIALLHKFSASQARNAYSAILLIPGFLHLQHNILLRKIKKEWSTNQVKYPNFWDGSRV